MCTTVTRLLRASSSQCNSSVHVWIAGNIEHRTEPIQTDWLVDVTMNYRSRFVVSVRDRAPYQQYLVCCLPMKTVDAGEFATMWLASKSKGICPPKMQDQNEFTDWIFGCGPPWNSSSAFYDSTLLMRVVQGIAKQLYLDHSLIELTLKDHSVRDTCHQIRRTVSGFPGDSWMDLRRSNP